MERNHGCDMSNPQTRVLSYSDVRPTTSVLHHPLDRMILDRNYVDYRPVYSQRSTATDRYVDHEDEAILSTGAYTTAVQSRALAHASRMNVGATVVYNPTRAVNSRAVAIEGVHYPYGNEDRHLRSGGSSA